MESNSISNIIHDCGATDTLFRNSDAHLLTGPNTAGTLCVGLPNGEVIRSHSSANFDAPNFSTKLHIFPDKLLNRSLMATADFCNNGCTAIFNSTSATIIHDETGQIISRSLKDPQARLWPFDPSSVSPKFLANNVVRHEINADFVAYCHASFCSPPDSSMYEALRKGYLGNYPRLTAKMFRSNMPNSPSTAKGHLKQRRQTSKNKKRTASSDAPYISPAPGKSTLSSHKLCSRKPPGRHKNVRPPLSAVNNAESTEHDFLEDGENQKRNSDLLVDDETAISIKIIRSSDLNSSDMAGRFPFISHRGYEYMLISVFRGYIHVELLKNRTAAELVRAYRATYDFYFALGFSPSIQMLDNETGKELKLFFQEIKVKTEYVPPNSHRRNRAERAIQDWKGHFISCLCNLDPDFPMFLWCELVLQAKANAQSSPLVFLRSNSVRL